MVGGVAIYSQDLRNVTDGVCNTGGMPHAVSRHQLILRIPAPPENTHYPQFAVGDLDSDSYPTLEADKAKTRPDIISLDSTFRKHAEIKAILIDALHIGRSNSLASARFDVIEHCLKISNGFMPEADRQLHGSRLIYSCAQKSASRRYLRQPVGPGPI